MKNALKTYNLRLKELKVVHQLCSQALCMCGHGEDHFGDLLQLNRMLGSMLDLLKEMARIVYSDEYPGTDHEHSPYYHALLYFQSQYDVLEQKIVYSNMQVAA